MIVFRAAERRPTCAAHRSKRAMRALLADRLREVRPCVRDCGALMTRPDGAGNTMTDDYACPRCGATAAVERRDLLPLYDAAKEV